MKNLTFCAFIAILILLLFAVYGCGTRKTDLARTETKSSNINIENQYTSGTKIVLGSSFTYTPFDGLKPMVIDGKRYDNAIIKSENKKEYTRNISQRTKYNIVKTIIVEKTKTIDRTDNTILWLGMFLIVVIGTLAYLSLKKWGII